MTQDKTQILKFAYLPTNPWVTRLMGRFNSSDSQHIIQYLKSQKGDDLSRRTTAIATKIQILRFCIDKLEDSIKEVFSDLEQNPSKVEEHIAGGFAYQLTDRSLIFRIVADLDLFVLEFRSAYEMVQNFMRDIYENCFSCKLNKAQMYERMSEMIKNSGMDTQWVDDLRDFRHLFAHETAPWIQKVYYESGQSDIIVLTSVLDDYSPSNSITIGQIWSIHRAFSAALTVFEQEIVAEILTLEGKKA